VGGNESVGGLEGGNVGELEGGNDGEFVGLDDSLTKLFSSWGKMSEKV